MSASAAVIEIGDGRASVGIVPGLGGGLAWFRWNGPEPGEAVDWLRPAASAALAANMAGELACFPLLPYSNRVRDGRFAFAAHHVQLPAGAADPHFEHGHGWRGAWTPVTQTAAQARLRYRHAADAWPWAYEAEQDIALDKGVLSIRLTLRNFSPEPMPAGFGLHPYFPAPPGTFVETRVAGMWEADAQVLPTRHAALDEAPRRIEVAAEALDNVFTGWSRQARIAWPEQGRALTLEAAAPLDFLVLYTPRDAGFFCCEPVSNVTDAFNLAARGIADTGLFVLAPGAARTAGVRFVPRLADISQS